MAQDLGVYAKCYQDYQDDPTELRLALVVLSQRIVLEKGASYLKKRGKMPALLKLIGDINRDPITRLYYINQTTKSCKLVQKYPNYIKAKLIV